MLRKLRSRSIGAPIPRAGTHGSAHLVVSSSFRATISLLFSRGRVVGGRFTPADGTGSFLTTESTMPTKGIGRFVAGLQSREACGRNVRPPSPATPPSGAVALRRRAYTHGDELFNDACVPQLHAFASRMFTQAEIEDPRHSLATPGSRRTPPRGLSAPNRQVFH